MLKNGLVYAVPVASTEIYAACPMYANNRHGYTTPSHDIWIARQLEEPYLLYTIYFSPLT